MYKFHCPICLKEHPLLTLIEFPQPQIIFDISSGRMEGTLEYLSKHIFRINNDFTILQCQLNFPIQDYEDQCELLVWGKITRSNFQDQEEAMNTQEEVLFKGELIHAIPFLSDRESLEIDLNVSLVSEETPLIQRVHQAPEIRTLMEDGFSQEELFAYLARLYHHH